MLHLKKENSTDFSSPMIGKLAERENAKKGFVSLEEIDTKIGKIRFQRETLINLFLDDIHTILKKMKSDYQLEVNPKKLIYDKYLSLNFVSSDNLVNTLVSNDRLEHISEENHQVSFIISKSMPYIRGLFRVFEEDENILSNQLYKDLYADFDSIIQRLVINGDGVNLLPSNLSKNLTEEDKLYFLAYFYQNYQSILSKTLIPDDTILERYDTSLDPKKILTLYRGRK